MKDDVESTRVDEDSMSKISHNNLLLLYWVIFPKSRNQCVGVLYYFLDSFCLSDGQTLTERLSFVSMSEIHIWGKVAVDFSGLLTYYVVI
jgi:hypothetical protein